MDAELTSNLIAADVEEFKIDKFAEFLGKSPAKSEQL